MIIRTYFCYIFFIVLIISSFMMHTHAAEIKSANLYIISDKAFVGDRSQLLGVARESEKYFKSKSVKLNVEEYDKSQLETVKDQIKGQISSNKNLAIIVSVGYYGIESITKLKSDPELAKKIIAVHLSHQLLDNGTLSHKQLVQEKRDNFFGADIIVLPSHALDKQNTKLTGVNTILLTTNGVAHNMQVSDIESEYGAFKSMFSSFDKYLAVILAGDVPENGTYHCYTNKEAEKLAEYVSNLALKNNYFVLVSNGPRTGKYDCQNNKELSVHEKDSIMDTVTSSFQRVLQENRVPFKLFDFKKGQPNMYKAILGAVLYNKHSLIIVPGESTSMVSETVDMLPAKTVTVYYNSTMNEAHKRHIKNEFNEGRVSIIDENMHLHLPNIPNNMRAIVNSGELDSRNDGAKPIDNRRAIEDDVTKFSSIDYKYYSASENIAKGIYTLWHTRTVTIPKVIK